MTEQETPEQASTEDNNVKKQQEEVDDDVQQDEEDDAQPTTAVIMLGEGIFLRPEAQVLSLSILEGSALAGCLATAAAPASLDAIHLIVKAHQVRSKYDETCVTELATKLCPGGEWTVHILLEEGQQEVDADVVETFQSSFVLGGLMIAGEGTGEDGSKTVTARKPPSVPDEDVDEDS